MPREAKFPVPCMPMLPSGSSTMARKAPLMGLLGSDPGITCPGLYPASIAHLTSGIVHVGSSFFAYMAYLPAGVSCPTDPTAHLIRSLRTYLRFKTLSCHISMTHLSL